MADTAHHGPWGPCETDAAVNTTHDMGLYEALFSLTMFFVFKGMDAFRSWVPGVQVLILGAAYAPVRFAMDFLRPDSTDNRLLGFTPAQYWSAIFMIAVIGFIVVRSRSGDAPLEPVKPSEAEPEKKAG